LLPVSFVDIAIITANSAMVWLMISRRARMAWWADFL
jgi:hypothetical protein